MEMRSNRLTEDQLEEKRREKALKDEETSRQRKERSKHIREEMKIREIEELKPKARSALAARWEERIRAKGEGKISREEHGSTVLTGTTVSRWCVFNCASGFNITLTSCYVLYSGKFSHFSHPQ